MKTKWLKMAVVLAVVSLSANALAVSWTGGGSDNLWTNPDNWDTGVVPSEADTLGDIIYLSTGAGTEVLIDSTMDITIVNDILGPEWGTTLTIDGGSLTQIHTPDYYGWRIAPVQWDSANPSYLNVLNGGSLTASNLCLGDEWWWGGGPYVITSLYDTSTVNVNEWLYLGGILNLYGGTMDIAGGIHLDTHSQGVASIDVMDGTLIIRDDSFTAETVQAWEDSGVLVGFGGAGDVIIDDSTGDVVITARIPEPATMVLLGLGGLMSLRKRK